MKHLMVVVLLIIGMEGCVDLTVPPFNEKVETNSDFDVGYTEFEVDGMPCIIVGRRNGDDSMEVWQYDGVTCDWSKRKDEDDGTRSEK